VCCRWLDAGKFLTGFSAVGSIAIPAILAHAQVKQRHRVVGQPQGACVCYLLAVDNVGAGTTRFMCCLLAANNWQASYSQQQLVFALCFQQTTCSRQVAECNSAAADSLPAEDSLQDYCRTSHQQSSDLQCYGSSTSCRGSTSVMEQHQCYGNSTSCRGSIRQLMAGTSVMAAAPVLWQQQTSVMAAANQGYGSSTSCRGSTK
jgi:hypothetical protein